MSRRFRVGVQLHPQHTSMADLRAAWERADGMGVDSIFTWDHFYPLYGAPDGPHFEGMSVLTAMALTTTNAEVGLMVTCNSYRNPELLADMYRTIDHLCEGRIILGIGSGWFERDYTEYGYSFGTAVGRLDALRTSLERIESRMARLNPPPTRKIPVLIGGSGEKVTLRLVAEHADSWNTFGPVDNWAAKNRILDQHCADVGRNGEEIERTVCIGDGDIDGVDAFVEAGAQHVILMCGHPFDLGPLERLLAAAEG